MKFLLSDLSLPFSESIVAEKYKSNLQGDRETCECYTPEERVCKKWSFHTIDKNAFTF